MEAKTKISEGGRVELGCVAPTGLGWGREEEKEEVIQQTSAVYVVNSITT